MDATNASDLDLDRGVLPGQQAVVRCRNSVKAEDFLDSFFIHSIFVQTLSDMSVCCADKCHTPTKCHSPRQMSQQPSTNVTANDKCHNIASTNVTALDK